MEKKNVIKREKAGAKENNNASKNETISMGLTTMDSLWWGSVVVFTGGCVAAVRTGANKDSAYGRWKQKKEEKEALQALEMKKSKGKKK